jgi:hypothetical protein
MEFLRESVWSLFCYLVPGILLGMGFAFRREGLHGYRELSPARNGGWTARILARQAVPQAALRVGWGLLGASLLAHGLGTLAELSRGRILGLCLVLDMIALAVFLLFLEMHLRETMDEEG